MFFKLIWRYTYPKHGSKNLPILEQWTHKTLDVLYFKDLRNFTIHILHWIKKVFHGQTSLFGWYIIKKISLHITVQVWMLSSRSAKVAYGTLLLYHLHQNLLLMECYNGYSRTILVIFSIYSFFPFCILFTYVSLKFLFWSKTLWNLTPEKNMKTGVWDSL